MFCFCICLSGMYGLFSFFLKDKEHPVEYREQTASTRPLFKWGSDICLLNRKQSDLSLLPMTGTLALWKQGQQQGYGQIEGEAFTNQLRFLPEGTSWTKTDKTVSKVTHNSLELKERMEVRFPKCCGSARSTCTHCLDPVAHPKLIMTSCQKCVFQWVWICSTVTGNFAASFGNTIIYSPCPVFALSRAGGRRTVQSQLSHSQDQGSWFTCHL